MSGARASIALTALLLVLALVAAQVAAIPAPVLTGSDKSMEQYESFHANVARDGPHDLIVFGNSIARQGVDARQLQRELGEALGRPFQVYNFAAGGTPASALDFLAGLAFGVDDPRMCLVVLSARMSARWGKLSEQRSRLLHTSPYGEALNDPIRWRGALRRALLDHVALASLRHKLFALAHGEPRPLREPGRYDPQRGSQTPRSSSVRHEMWAELRRADRAWAVKPEKMRTLVGTLGRVRAHCDTLWVAQAPLHPRRIGAFEDPERLIAETRSVVSAASRVIDAIPLLLPANLPFRAEHFSDPNHLGPAGARRYTRWLSERIAADSSRATGAR